jgi:glycosyltransferase involved in cell wall biosynthesis
VLPYSIGSVLDQTFADFEVLVIGDGCTDDSEQVVRGIVDPRVRWINLPRRTGHQSTPNNRGLAEARGEFIAYLGHDDLWLPHHLASLVQALESSGGAMAHSLMIWVPEGADAGLPLLPASQVKHFGWPSCTMHRRDLTERIGGWRDHRTLDMPPDGDLWQRAYAAGHRFTFVPRLSVIKFPASVRANVYRIRPCHEQAAWLAQIRSDPDFEAHQLVRILLGDEGARFKRVRTLARLLIAETTKRLMLSSGFSRRTGRVALFWRVKGAGIRATQKYKGLDPDV